MNPLMDLYAEYWKTLTPDEIRNKHNESARRKAKKEIYDESETRGLPEL